MKHISEAVALALKRVKEQMAKETREIVEKRAQYNKEYRKLGK